MRDVRSERRATTLSQHRIRAIAIAGLATLAFSTALASSSWATARSAAAWRNAEAPRDERHLQSRHNQRLLHGAEHHLAWVHAAARLISVLTEFREASAGARVAVAVRHGERRHQRRRQDVHVPPQPGVKWDTAPPRQVTAADFVREFKMLCNPASPTGRPAISRARSSAWRRTATASPKSRERRPRSPGYVDSHPLPGVVANGPLTLVFHLINPAPDFLNILALPFCSARPVEYMKYVPDSARFRQHTISDGPYKIVEVRADEGVPTRAQSGVGPEDG